MRAEIVSFNKKKQNTLRMSGFKHCFPPILCAALMLNMETTLHNVPPILEKQVFCDLLRIMGKRFTETDNGLHLFPSEKAKQLPPDLLTKLIHGSIYLHPVCLYEMGQIHVIQSGGCRIGSENSYSTRPISHVIDVLERFGSLKTKDDLTLPNGFRPAVIDIMEYSDRVDLLCGPYVSGATKTAILCASVCNGQTSIMNPYLKADVMELISFLQSAGLHIRLIGNQLIICPSDHACQSTTYTLCPDLIEIITFICFALYYNVRLTIEELNLELVQRYLAPELSLLHRMGVELIMNGHELIVPEDQTIHNLEIIASGEGIYSDSQPFFTLMLSKAGDGSSTVQDLVWANRLEYADELRRAGLNLNVCGNQVTIQPGARPFGTKTLHAKDLRGAAVLTLFALEHEGVIIDGVEHLERGYACFWKKLEHLGATVKLYA